MLLQGPSINSRKKRLEQPALTISQLIVHNSIKRSRKESTFHRLSKVRESPLRIYLGMLMHAKTRKKGIIERLSSLGLSILHTSSRTFWELKFYVNMKSTKL